jgi:3D (Asp-Asp-Asp) domain-containing protein
MRIFLRGVLPAFTFLLMLNVAINAQPAPERSQSDSTTPNGTKDTAKDGAPEAVKDAVKEAMKAASIEEAPAPNLNLIHSSLDLTAQPSTSKLPKLNFALPETGSKSAPRSFEATAYTLRGRTASGVETRPGVVAADPQVLPLGSVVQIKAGNYSGVYTVHDTGPRVKGNLVDVWMPSNKEARLFGRRNIKLHVLRYGPTKNVKPAPLKTSLAPTKTSKAKK